MRAVLAAKASNDALQRYDDDLDAAFEQAREQGDLTPLLQTVRRWWFEAGFWRDPDAQREFLARLDPPSAADPSGYRRSAIISFMDRADETAGSLLRRARVGAAMSQAELAFRAGVVQSVISAYEAGRRQPSLPALARLIDAAGWDLVVDVQSQPPQLSRLSGPVGRQVRRKRRDLVAAAAAHDVTNLRVFGSVARGEDQPGSDVDLLVDLPPGIGLLGLGRVQAELEAIVGTKVDLVPASDLKPAVRARAERDLVAL
jgi:predicted nucleotidyltransferase/DNA-binding XRE family transcriptional regulator